MTMRTEVVRCAPMIRPMIRANIVGFLCFMETLGLLSNRITADILITTSGGRWEGEVVEDTDSYVVVKPDGSKMSFSKSMVSRVIKSQEYEVQFRKMLESADLADDTAVRELVLFAKEHGLPADRVLKQVYASRFGRAKERQDTCQALAKWCRENGLVAEAKECDSQTARLVFPEKFGAAQDDLPSLLALHQWCLEHNLAAEVATVEAAALKLAPEDASVRAKLGYIRGSAGEWRKDPFMPQGVSADIRVLAKPPLGVRVVNSPSWRTLPRTIGLVCTFGQLAPPASKMAEEWLQATVDLRERTRDGGFIPRFHPESVTTVVSERLRQCDFACTVPTPGTPAPLSAILKGLGEADVYLVVALMRREPVFGWSSSGIGAEVTVHFVLFDKQQRLLAAGSDHLRVGVPGSRFGPDPTRMGYRFKEQDFDKASALAVAIAVDRGLLGLLQKVWFSADVHARLDSIQGTADLLSVRAIPEKDGFVLVSGKDSNCAALELVNSTPADALAVVSGPAAERRLRVERNTVCHVILVPGKYRIALIPAAEPMAPPAFSTLVLAAGEIYRVTVAPSGGGK
jgi:hypothetical protein